MAWFVPLLGMAARVVFGAVRSVGGAAIRSSGRLALSELLGGLENDQRQVRFAAAVALTRTARELAKLEAAEARRVFDRPTRYTLNAFGFTPATVARLQASVFIKDRQAAYLAPNIVGGRRGQKAFERRLAGETKTSGFWAPGEGVRLNAAGNLSQKQLLAIAAGLRRSGKFSDVFVGKPTGHPGAPFGIWGRIARGRRGVGGIKPLLIYVAPPQYEKRFNFRGVVERNAQPIFNREFALALADASRSTRQVSQTIELRIM